MEVVLDTYGKKLAFLRDFCYLEGTSGKASKTTEGMDGAFSAPLWPGRESKLAYALLRERVCVLEEGERDMELYEPDHQFLTSWNAPYEPSYLTIEEFPGKRFWTWGLFTTLKGSEELRSKLQAEGWEPWNEQTRPFFQILESHFAQTLLLKEDAYGVQYWTQTSSLTFAQHYPVLLSCQTDTLQTDELDYPQVVSEDIIIGSCALIPENEHYCLLTLDQLAENQGQKLSKRIAAGMMISAGDTYPYDLERRLRAKQRVAAWETTHIAATQLAILYWELYQQQHTKTPPRTLPALNSAHRTRLPITNSFRGLAQSFGPAVQPSLFNDQRQEVGTLELLTPNGSLLQIVGTNTAEKVALHRYVTQLLGPEGLKHLIILLDAYYLQTQAAGQKVDARVSLRQLLLRMGAGSRADDREEQRKLMHSILYLASTYITSDERPSEAKPLPLARQTRRRKQGRKVYSPLLVIERLKPGPDGSIQIPDEVEYHLGSEFFDALFGPQQQFFSLPTALLLGFHAVREQQELLLAFYLSNALITAKGQFLTTFSMLLLQSALQSQDDLAHGHDRMRDTQRVLVALEQLEQQGIVWRQAHEAVDKALMMGLVTGKFKQEEIASATLHRIEQEIAYHERLSAETLRTNRRVAFQHLLDERTQQPITFLAGPLLIDQISQHAARQRIKQEQPIAPPIEAKKPRQRSKRQQNDL
jgi:hypothetical protein